LSWRLLGGGWPPLSGLCVGAHGLAAGARQACRPPSSAIGCAQITPNLPQCCVTKRKPVLPQMANGR
jgi:hypothetical protein